MHKEIIEAAGGCLAVVSKDSDKAFCGRCYEHFFEWIELKILYEDRTIQQILNNKRMSEKYNLSIPVIIEICIKANQHPANCSVCEITKECTYKQLKGQFACIESRKRHFLKNS